MRGELHVQSATVTLVLHGELDLLTVERLRALLDDACSEPGSVVVVDLTDVVFVDVLSLSTILAAADSLRERGGDLRVRGARAPVRRVCALLNASDVLSVELPLPRVPA